LTILEDNADRVKDFTSELKADYDIFTALKAMDRPTPTMKAVCERSAFNLFSVEQVVRLFKASNWEMSEKITNMLTKCTMAILSTQVCEDLNNVMKTTRASPGTPSTDVRSLAMRLQSPLMFLAWCTSSIRLVWMPQSLAEALP
jgi:hypothetical protein